MMFSYSPPQLLQLVAPMPRSAHAFVRLSKSHRTAAGRVARSDSTPYDWWAEWDYRSMSLSGGVSGVIGGVYDQSGNARNMGQPGNSPSTGTAGVPLFYESRACCRFTGVANQSLSAPAPFDNLGVGTGSPPLTIATHYAENAVFSSVPVALGRDAAKSAGAVWVEYDSAGIPSGAFDSTAGGPALGVRKVTQTTTGRHYFVLRKALNEPAAQWSVRQNSVDCPVYSPTPETMALDSGTLYIGSLFNMWGYCTFKWMLTVVWNVKLDGTDLSSLENFLRAQRTS